MSLVSDPSLRAASAEFDRQFDGAARAPLVRPDALSPLARVRRFGRRLTFGVATVAGVLLVLRVMAGILAEPLEPINAPNAPAWQVQVSTNSAKGGIVLAYGAEVGVQVLRIPAKGATGDNARVIPARIARGELHLVTLSWNALHVEAPGAPGSGVVSVSASAPIITIFQSPKMSGIRGGW